MEGARLKELRKALGLTLEQFGKKIGLTKSALSLMENDRNEMTPRTRLAICREYGVSEKWLETGEGEMFMADTQAYRRLREKVDRMLSDESDAFRAALVDVVMRLNSEQIDILKEYAAKYYGVDVGSGLASQESAGSGPDPGAAPREADNSQGPAFDQASAETAADPAETLQKRSGLSEEDEAEIRRKAQEYADMLREEKRAEGRSSSLRDGRLKKEA